MSGRKLKVAVLFGGRSAEHEISLLSARFVVESLDRERFEPVLVGIDKDGRWLVQDAALLLEASRDPRMQKLNQAAPSAALVAHPVREGESALRVGLNPTAPGGAVDVVFPVLHGPMGEDGAMQGLLELSGLPYVGAGVLGSSVGMDKDVMKRLLKEAGLPIVPHVTFRKGTFDATRDLAAAEALGYPLFVKPANLGSSVGIARAKSREGLVVAIADAFRYDTKVVVEAGLDAPREIECAVLGGDAPRASIVGEIEVTHPDGFYSYAAKYLDENGAALLIPAAISAKETAHVQQLAVRTFQTLECFGMARVDFFLTKKGELYVNEINTIPGFTAISMYPKLWEASGVGAKELVATLIDLAIARTAIKRTLKTSV